MAEMIRMKPKFIMDIINLSNAEVTSLSDPKKRESTYLMYMEQEEEDRSTYFECKICHLKFRNKTYFESHMIMEHEKRAAPSGVQ
jgi:hypothetical protein